MQILSLNIPTNRPEEYFNVIHPSFRWLKPMVKTVSVVVCFTFQPPWTTTQIDTVKKDLTALGMTMRFTWCRPPTDRLVSMNALRMDAAFLCPEADWWMMADDNLMFREEGTAKFPGGSAIRYLQVLDYMNRFKNCGVVMCEGSFGGRNHQYQIRPTKNGLISTTRGLFYRNTNKGHLYTPEEVLIKGGMCEIAPAYRLMSQGYFLAKQFNNPTRHLHKHRFGDDVGPLHIANYSMNIVPHAERYIRDLYQDPQWTLEERYIPRQVWNQYKAAGGDMKAFSRPSPYWKNYDHRRPR